MNWKTASLCDGGECVQVGWHKAGASGGGNCVEVGWDKSSHSNLNNCVEVGAALEKSSHSIRDNGCVESGPCACGGDVLVHDTKECKDPDHCTHKLAFSREVWGEFLAAIRAGELVWPGAS